MTSKPNSALPACVFCGLPKFYPQALGWAQVHDGELGVHGLACPECLVDDLRRFNERVRLPVSSEVSDEGGEGVMAC